MGIPFDQTVRGCRFFDVQLPQLIKALNRLADIEEEKLKIMKEKTKKGEESHE